MEPGRRSRSALWKRLLDVGTGLVVLLVLGLLVHDRLLPELRRMAEVEVGDRVPSGVRYRLHGSGDTVRAALPGPSLHLVFQSGCPACGRTLPAWREILGARPGLRVYGVGIEPPAPALRYVRRHLPTALAVGPVEEDAYLRVLRITVVPTTLLVDGGGRLIWRREGVLGPADVEEILGALPATRPDHSTEGEDAS